jgi:predicted enzyme related to lactoylglutathione lyase
MVESLTTAARSDPARWCNTPVAQVELWQPVLYNAGSPATPGKSPVLLKPKDFIMTLLRIVAVFAAVAFVGACSSVKLPAVTEAPTGSFLPGKIIWHDLISDTPEASRRFYAELLGWQFEDVGAGMGEAAGYSLIRHNGRLIGGMVDQTRLQTRADISQWVTVISVADADVATASVRADGGHVFSDPIDIGGRGRLAVVADPQGALFALLQTGPGDPLDRDEVSVGEFLWDELWTADIDAAAVFYRKLGGYELEDIDVAGNSAGVEGRYRLLRSQGRPRLGIMKNPVNGLQPTWINYLRVADAAMLRSIVERVPELGGAVLLEPQQRVVGGWAALIAGPSGAGIALQTWPLDE